MSKRILNMETAQNLGTWATQLNAMIAAFKTKSYAIEKSKKLGVRTMAEGREGYARLVNRGAAQHSGYLNRNENQAELEAQLAYDNNLEALRQASMAFAEMIADTQWGNSADIMINVDGFVQSLQSQRGRDSALDNFLDEIDEWNKRYASQNPSTPNTPPNPTPPAG